jgi:hypothetical protein
MVSRCERTSPPRRVGLGRYGRRTSGSHRMPAWLSIVGLGVGESVGVEVGAGVSQDEGVGVGVWLAVGVLDGVRVAVRVSVAVGAGVSVVVCGLYENTSSAAWSGWVS